MEWLDELETQVREASERLGELREENEALRGQLADLELKLARVEEAANREREEVRGRVERLTRQLEGLV